MSCQRHAESLIAIRTSIPFGGWGWDVGSVPAPKDHDRLARAETARTRGGLPKAGLGVYLYMDDEQWEQQCRDTARKIIPLLHGMPINQARYTLQTAEQWLLATSTVDAGKIDLIEA